MALILKTNKEYTPVNNMGLDLTGSDYYGVIDDVRYNKKDKLAYFTLDIYANEASGLLRKSDSISVVDRINFTFDGIKFDDKVGYDGLSIPQAYLLALETLTDWESDEN